jgi:transcriptional regulator with XRE-family HTH domain
MVIGKHLRDLREAKGLTQGDIQQRTGLLPCYVSRIENGRTVPSVETLRKLAAACEIPLWKIFYAGKERPELFVVRGESKKESPKDVQFLAKLSPLLDGMNQRKLHLLLQMAQGMARKGRGPESRSAAIARSRLSD